MTTDANTTEINTGTAPIEPGTEQAIQPPILPSPPETRPRLRKFPGVMAIGAYMILLAGVVCYGVVQGGIPPFYLVFSVFFIAGALGLLMLFRWGWALTLAAVAMMSAFYFWTFYTQQIESSLVQGLLNLIFFLYLVRSDLREKMR
jgi:hypothetical protein